MHVTILSKALELAANLAYWSALWLLAKLFGRGGEISVGDGSGVELDGMELDGMELGHRRRDKVLTVRVPRRRTTVVVVKAEEGAGDVIVSIGVTR